MKVTVFMTVTAEVEVDAHGKPLNHIGRGTARRQMVIEIDPAIMAGDDLTAQNALVVIGCRLTEAMGFTVVPAEA